MEAIIKSITGSKMSTDFELTDRPYDILKRLAKSGAEGTKYLFKSDLDFTKFQEGTTEIETQDSTFALLDGSEDSKELEIYTPLSEQLTDFKVHDKDPVTFVVAISMVVGHRN